MTKLQIGLSVSLFTLFFCIPSFVSHAEYTSETEVVHNRFSIAVKKDNEADIDWVDTISIQWCEYPYDVTDGLSDTFSLDRLEEDEEEIVDKTGIDGSVKDSTDEESDINKDNTDEKSNVNKDSTDEESDTNKDSTDEESDAQKNTSDSTDTAAIPEKPVKVLKDNLDVDKYKESNETNDEEVELDEQ